MQLPGHAHAITRFGNAPEKAARRVFSRPHFPGLPFFNFIVIIQQVRLLVLDDGDVPIKPFDHKVREKPAA